MIEVVNKSKDQVNVRWGDYPLVENVFDLEFFVLSFPSLRVRIFVIFYDGGSISMDLSVFYEFNSKDLFNLSS